MSDKTKCKKLTGSIQLDLSKTKNLSSRTAKPLLNNNKATDQYKPQTSRCPEKESLHMCMGEKPTKKPAITTNTEQVHVDTPPKMVPAKRSLPPHEEENASKKPVLSERVIRPSKKVPVTLSSSSSLRKLKPLWHSEKKLSMGGLKRIMMTTMCLSQD